MCSFQETEIRAQGRLFFLPQELQRYCSLNSVQTRSSCGCRNAFWLGIWNFFEETQGGLRLEIHNEGRVEVGLRAKQKCLLMRCVCFQELENDVFGPAIFVWYTIIPQLLRAMDCCAQDGSLQKLPFPEQEEKTCRFLQRQGLRLPFISMQVHSSRDPFPRRVCLP